jgi:hypothetical protein
MPYHYLICPALAAAALVLAWLWAACAAAGRADDAADAMERDMEARNE